MLMIVGIKNSRRLVSLEKSPQRASNKWGVSILPADWIGIFSVCLLSRQVFSEAVRQLSASSGRPFGLAARHKNFCALSRCRTRKCRRAGHWPAMACWLNRWACRLASRSRAHVMRRVLAGRATGRGWVIRPLVGRILLTRAVKFQRLGRELICQDGSMRRFGSWGSMQRAPVLPRSGSEKAGQGVGVGLQANEHRAVPSIEDAPPRYGGR